MKICNKFKKIFDIFIEKEKSRKLLQLVNLMYEKKILDEELTLNLLKALILILYINKDNYDVYYELLTYITFNMNKKFRKYTISKLQNLDLSLQFNLDEKFVDKIIINTNLLMLNTTFVDIESLIDLWLVIIDNICSIKSSILFKVSVYIHFIKHINEKIIKKQTIDNELYSESITYMKAIVNTINNFL